MNRMKVARELVKLAREMTADRGDVAVYLNVSDFFASGDGNRSMSSAQMEAAMDSLQNAALQSQALMETKRTLKEWVKRGVSKRLADNNLVLKK